MNLQILFQAQGELDLHILDKHPELKGQDNLSWKVLSFQVELGECANEWRGFKKWSSDQNPRTHKIIKVGENDTCETNPLLEEYVDCLHFLLSIGLEIECTNIEVIAEVQEENIIDAFLSVFEHCIMMDIMPNKQLYANLFGHFVSLGIMLGFTWEQIEAAYFEKNKVNHERQNKGY